MLAAVAFGLFDTPLIDLNDFTLGIGSTPSPCPTKPSSANFCGLFLRRGLLARLIRLWGLRFCVTCFGSLHQFSFSHGFQKGPPGLDIQPHQTAAKEMATRGQNQALYLTLLDPNKLLVYSLRGKFAVSDLRTFCFR